MVLHDQRSRNPQNFLVLDSFRPYDMLIDVMYQYFINVLADVLCQIHWYRLPLMSLGIYSTHDQKKELFR